MTNKNGCILLLSLTHDDCHAYPMARSVDKSSTESLMAFAQDFASTLALDSGEVLSVHVSEENDPGRARLEGALTGYVGKITIE